MVEGEEVLKRDVSPHLTEADLPQKLLRKRVSKSDVLDSEVGHIQQILALHLHREAGVLSAEVPGARIEGVGAVLSPVIGGKGLRESAFLCAVARNGKLSASPDLALADTLEEDGEVESLPICAVFSNLVLSHSEPKLPVTKKMIVEYRKKTSVIEWLTWTRNGDAEDFSVETSINNLIKKNPESAVWISGHRPVAQKYALRQNGKLIQIHNPDFENIAFIVPEKTFNPETDIFCVRD